MLEDVIEKKRREMVKLAHVTGYTSKKTVKCSQELDKLINLFQLALQHNQSNKLNTYFASIVLSFFFF